MTAAQVFEQQDGSVTTAYYAELNARGPLGQIAVALFRAQKRSARAKDYRRGRYRRMAYEVKSWSMGELCRLLQEYGAQLGIQWGWKEDPEVVFGESASWVLYVDLPQGQVSFHSPSRGEGPDYPGEWDRRHLSAERILSFCDIVAQLAGEAEPLPAIAAVEAKPVAPSRPVFGDPDSIARSRSGRRRV